MFPKLALLIGLAALFGADANNPHSIKMGGSKVTANTKNKAVKSFSVCLYIPYGGYRRLEEERELGEVDAEGTGFGYFYYYGVGLNLELQYTSAIMYNCDTGDELGTYGVFCNGDIGFSGYGPYGGAPVQYDCEHNLAFAGNPGSALVIHTSEGVYGTSVTTVGGSGKFAKSIVHDVNPFQDGNQMGLTLQYKTRGYNPMYFKDKTVNNKVPTRA